MTGAPAPDPVRALVRDAERELARAGVASPRHDAEVLAAHAFGVPRSRLVLVDSRVAEAARGRLCESVARRAAREPLQHVTGTAPFRRLELQVGPGVLVPRPETELLVDAVLDCLKVTGVVAPRVVDLGTGSGAIALAVADECPAAQVWAVEREEAALRWAARNVAALKSDGALVAGAVTLIAGTVTLIAGDMADALPELDGSVDVVVSNPPYLSQSVLCDLSPEVRDFDPVNALVAGPDALAAVRTVERVARRLLRPGGLAVVEHGDDQGVAAPACFAAGWSAVADHADLNGRPRYLTAVHT